MSGIQQFLLAFDRGNNRLVVERHFGEDAEAALEAYQELEQEHLNNPLMDVVLVGSDSIESVRVTHSNYFDGVSLQLIEAALSRTSFAA